MRVGLGFPTMGRLASTLLLPIWLTGPALISSFSTSTRRVPQTTCGTMCPLAPQSLGVLALCESCVGCGTGDSAPHPVLLAGFPIIVPAVLGLIVPHPALVSRLTSPRLIPSRGRPLPTLCALVANREECDPCLVPGHVSHLSLALLLLSSVQDFSSLVRRIQSTGLCILFRGQTNLLYVQPALYLSFEHWQPCWPFLD